MRNSSHFWAKHNFIIIATIDGVKISTLLEKSYVLKFKD